MSRGAIGPSTAIAALTHVAGDAFEVLVDRDECAQRVNVFHTRECLDVLDNRQGGQRDYCFGIFLRSCRISRHVSHSA